MYLPDLPKRIYQELLDTLVQEFTYTFGGCTILRGLDGRYLSGIGLMVTDRINLVYTDILFSLENDPDKISQYTDYLRDAVAEGLEEETVLIAAVPVYHVV